MSIESAAFFLPYSSALCRQADASHAAAAVTCCAALRESPLDTQRLPSCCGVPRVCKTQVCSTMMMMMMMARGPTSVQQDKKKHVNPQLMCFLTCDSGFSITHLQFVLKIAIFYRVCVPPNSSRIFHSLLHVVLLCHLQSQYTVMDLRGPHQSVVRHKIVTL